MVKPLVTEAFCRSPRSGHTTQQRQHPPNLLHELTHYVRLVSQPRLSPVSYRLPRRLLSPTESGDVLFYPATPTGAAIAYLDLAGPPGNPVSVYLGGLGSSGIVAFAPVVGHSAAAGYGRHVLVDLIGSGWSDHDDAFGHTIEEHASTVAGLLDALNLQQVRLVGHSLGGSVAIALAARRPDLVCALVLAEPNLDPGVGTFSRAVASFTEGEFARTGHADVVLQLLSQARAGDVNAAEFARTVRRWSSRGLHRTACSLLADREPTFRSQLASLPVDRRYVSGELSRESLDGGRAAGCDVRVVPDAGHVLMTDNLDGFVAALIRP
jgi:pimeloyl-ACP methyl ester carboxylesterase